MGWRETAVRWLGYEVVREEVGRDDDGGWRALVAPRGATWGASGSERDLTDWRELLQEMYSAYCTNALAYAVIQQSVNFVLGGGARVVAADKRAQRWLDAFWHDRENAMDRRIYSFFTEPILFGEQFVRYFVGS